MAPGTAHISSTAIGRTADAVDLQLTRPLSAFLGNLRPQTDLPPGTFGQVGDLILGSAYRDLQETVESLLGDAVKVTRQWQEKLGHARRNWRTAEDLNLAEARAIGRHR
ncbi:hypothetical protein [Nonomuraea longicatena]|uniref:Uncharacterized protein n=1 Tax=Nonomuraea longicatena TaxID=83682 RepID=A0ABP4BLN1_9ACTN